MNPLIYLVEDDPGMAEVTAVLLARRGYKVKSLSTAEELLSLLRRQTPDLLISDIQLPGLSGLKLCELLKEDPRTASLPVILLTVLGKDGDKVRGLRQGADDYLAKPYNPEELLARVEALLRRVQRAGIPADRLQSGNISVDVSRREASVAGKPIELRRKEFELLVLFLRHPGRILTRDQIVSALWNDVIVTDNTLSAHVKTLRERLGPSGERIQTLIGEGYKFVEPS